MGRRADNDQETSPKAVMERKKKNKDTWTMERDKRNTVQVKMI
jgi:hypothetical protein